MKKIISILICGIMAFGLGGCAKQQISRDSDNMLKWDQENMTTTTTKKEEKAEYVQTETEKVALAKEQEESLTVYADMIANIQEMFPEITVKYIVNKKDGSGKALSIEMDLLESVDATEYKCAEIVTKKETVIKNEGITDVDIFIRNNGKIEDMIYFELQGSSFEPILNSF